MASAYSEGYGVERDTNQIIPQIYFTTVISTVMKTKPNQTREAMTLSNTGTTPSLSGDREAFLKKSEGAGDGEEGVLGRGSETEEHRSFLGAEPRPALLGATGA